MVTPTDIQAWIEAGVEDCQAEVQGDGHHFEARVISPAFAHHNTMKRHRMVYAALGTRMQSEIHALSLKTLTPEEAKKEI